MDVSLKSEDKGPHGRLRFPEDESRLPWLSMLLEAYAIIDAGVAVAVREEEARRGIKPACRKGCENCCRTQTDIPVYPLELVGVYWYVTEKLARPARKALRGQLPSHGRGDPCPFLIRGSCCIHLLRPVACRQFNVFGRPCGEGEDPYFTRREDVMTPMRDYTDRAFMAMLPFYGVTDEAQKAHVIKNDLIHTQATNLRTYPWENLMGAMEKFDSGKP